MQPRKNDTAWSQERKYAETGPERGKARLPVSLACDSGVRGRGGSNPKVTINGKRTGSPNEKYRTEVQNEEKEKLKQQRRFLFSN